MLTRPTTKAPDDEAADVAIERVNSGAALRAFLDVPHKVYAEDENWVPPLFVERRDHLSSRRNPYFRHADVQLFLARRSGEAVGRISAQIDRLRLERYRDATGQFGFLEALDDPAVFDALFATANDWLKTRGMERIQGPFSLSINDETGLLVDGFDRPPAILMGHAAPYYAGHLERLGFTKARDLIAYDYEGFRPFPRAMQHTVRKIYATGDLVVRPLLKSRLKEDLATIIDIFNDAWSQNWGFVPMTEAEITALGNNLNMLVSAEFVAIAFWRGQPAAMAVTLPDVNTWLRDLKGRVLPFGWAKLMWRMFSGPPEAVRMPLMGVRREYHHSPIGSALALAVIDSVRAYHLRQGTERAELSWVLEDNFAMRNMIERLGARPYKTYRVYERDVA